MYRLTRLRDGAGDSGGMSMVLWRDFDKNDIIVEHNARPRPGVLLRVGAITARSYSAQDWWQTTMISQILEETATEVRFMTANGSEYLWETYN